MKTFKKIFSIVSFLILGGSLLGQDSVTILRDSYLDSNAACPKTEYQYWVDTKPNYGNYEWKITGGSFIHLGQNVKQIFLPNTSSVIVVWENVKSNNGNAPKGTITLNIYKKSAPSEISGKGNRSQEIKSLKDMIPPSLSSNAHSSKLNFGEQEVKVYLDGAFNFPGIKKNGFPVPVTQYEWQIPYGWTAKTGKATSSGSYMTTTSEIQLITDASSGGEVKVRGVNDCAGSDDYSSYSWPFTFTREAGIEFLNYPESIPIGVQGTYEFSVLMLTGVSYEWQAPVMWKINNGGSTYEGGNVVQITTGECPTDEKVQIRMVQDNIFSSWVEFPTTIELPSINIPPGEILQYQPATFSLDMSDTNIASVEWLVDGTSVGIANNTSTLSFSIIASGNVLISTKLTLKGCSTVAGPEIKVNVKKGPAPEISGPSIIHGRSLYTIENLPPEASINWSAKGANLSPSGNDVYVIPSDVGTIELKAQITILEQTYNLLKNIAFILPEFRIAKSDNCYDFLGERGYGFSAAPVGVEIGFENEKLDYYWKCIEESTGNEIFSRTYYQSSFLEINPFITFPRTGNYRIEMHARKGMVNSPIARQTLTIDSSCVNQ